MKKKVVYLFVVALMVLTIVVGCAAPAASPAAEQPAAEEPAAEQPAAEEPAAEQPAAEEPAADSSDGIVIGSTANNVGTDAYQTKHDEAFRAHAETLGIELIQLDATGDVTKQINQVDDLIQQNVDVIVIWPVNGMALVPAAQEAYEAGIPVVIANSPIDPSGYDYTTCFVGPDNVLEGQYAGEIMKGLFTEEANIVEITGLPGYTTATERQQGFHDAVEGSNITIMESQPGDWNREKAQQQMENYLIKYPEIDAVYAADDNMAIGAINAITEAGRQDEIKVVSACFFGDDEAKAYIEDGRIAGSVLQSPMTDARTTLDVAVKIANGEEVEFFNYIDTPQVTTENISTIELEPWS